MESQTLAQSRFETVKKRIEKAESQAKRPKGAVCLLAVSKTKSSTMMAEFYRLGQRHFGENYVQEALIKQKELSAYNIVWHFIGPIQSNKTRLIANHFDWVHSIDSIKIARRLNEQRLESLPPLNVCLQVNISEESSKAGIPLSQLDQMVTEVSLFPHLRLRGVMAIPEPCSEVARQREPFNQLYQAVQRLNKVRLDTFSYGMSDDLEAAVQEGSTIVRIGTALFGSR